jgi:serine/threonine-protein kinase RsbW
MTSSDANGTGTDSTAFVLELPSDLRLIDSAVQYLVARCRDFHYSGSRLTLNLRVGVAEALANAMIYGNRRDTSKRVHVEVDLSMERLSIVVRDQGPGFDPATVPDPTLPENLERTGGRGIFLIRELMDEVDFNECGNCVRLTLYRDDARRTG